MDGDDRRDQPFRLCHDSRLLLRPDDSGRRQCRRLPQTVSLSGTGLLGSPYHPLTPRRIPDTRPTSSQPYGGQTLANLVWVGLGAGGQIGVFKEVGSAPVKR